jgi:hypothetical protein
MIRIKPRIERPDGDYKLPERIGSYLKDLIQEQIKFKKMSRDMRDFIADDWVKGIKRAIEDEIEYCEFYFELRKKRKDPTFKTWIFKEDYKEYSHSKPRKAWIISNGKVKIIIEIEEQEKSTWIKLKIDNDSKFIHFSPDGRRKEISTKILRSEKSTKEYIEELKERAEEIFKEYSKPRYNEEQRNTEFLDYLLGDQNGN